MTVSEEGEKWTRERLNGLAQKHLESRGVVSAMQIALRELNALEDELEQLRPRAALVQWAYELLDLIRTWPEDWSGEFIADVEQWDGRLRRPGAQTGRGSVGTMHMWHNWSKWAEGRVIKWATTKGHEVEALTQARRCEVCGKEQYRRINNTP